MKTQLQRLAPLLLRGCTSLDIARAIPSVSPHRRLTDARLAGWEISKKKNKDGLYVYKGKAPKVYK